MKVLIGFIIDGQAGGIDKYLLNFAKSVRTDKIKIDFLTNHKNYKLEQKLKECNSDLYEVASLKHPMKQYRQILELLKEKEYDMTYFNISTAMSIVGPYAAYKAGIPKRAIHSHSSGNDCECFWKRKILDCMHNFAKLFLYRYANQYYGCSKAAGYWLFPSKVVDSSEFKMIYNAVDLDEFKFDQELRKRLRKEYNLEDCLVLGHIGNFVYQKNHTYLIKIFDALVKKEPSSRLLLIGEGKNFDKIKEMVKHRKLMDKIFFLGWRSDVSELYQMMDMFLLPSNFEGLPIVGVEAQGTGLKCIFSNKITDEVKLTKEARFLPINKSADVWVRCIQQEKEYSREDNVLQGCKSCYDLKKQEENYKAIIGEI